MQTRTGWTMPDTRVYAVGLGPGVALADLRDVSIGTMGTLAYARSVRELGQALQTTLFWAVVPDRHRLVLPQSMIGNVTPAMLQRLCDTQHTAASSTDTSGSKDGNDVGELAHAWIARRQRWETAHPPRGISVDPSTEIALPLPAYRRYDMVAAVASGDVAAVPDKWAAHIHHLGDLTATRDLRHQSMLTAVSEATDILPNADSQECSGAAGEESRAAAVATVGAMHLPSLGRVPVLVERGDAQRSIAQWGLNAANSTTSVSTTDGTDPSSSVLQSKFGYTEERQSSQTTDKVSFVSVPASFQSVLHLRFAAFSEHLAQRLHEAQHNSSPAANDGARARSISEHLRYRMDWGKEFRFRMQDPIPPYVLTAMLPLAKQCLSDLVTFLRREDTELVRDAKQFHPLHLRLCDQLRAWTYLGDAILAARASRSSMADGDAAQRRQFVPLAHCSESLLHSCARRVVGSQLLRAGASPPPFQITWMSAAGGRRRSNPEFVTPSGAAHIAGDWIRSRRTAYTAAIVAEDETVRRWDVSPLPYPDDDNAGSTHPQPPSAASGGGGSTWNKQKMRGKANRAAREAKRLAEKEKKYADALRRGNADAEQLDAVHQLSQLNQLAPNWQDSSDQVDDDEDEDANNAGHIVEAIQSAGMHTFSTPVLQDDSIHESRLGKTYQNGDGDREGDAQSATATVPLRRGALHQRRGDRWTTRFTGSSVIRQKLNQVGFDASSERSAHLQRRQRLLAQTLKDASTGGGTDTTSYVSSTGAVHLSEAESQTLRAVAPFARPFARSFALYQPNQHQDAVATSASSDDGTSPQITRGQYLKCTLRKGGDLFTQWKGVPPPSTTTSTTSASASASNTGSSNDEQQHLSEHIAGAARRAAQAAAAAGESASASQGVSLDALLELPRDTNWWMRYPNMVLTAPVVQFLVWPTWTDVCKLVADTTSVALSVDLLSSGDTVPSAKYETWRMMQTSRTEQYEHSEIFTDIMHWAGVQPASLIRERYVSPVMHRAHAALTKEKPFHEEVRTELMAMAMHHESLGVQWRALQRVQSAISDAVAADKVSFSHARELEAEYSQWKHTLQYKPSSTWGSADGAERDPSSTTLSLGGRDGSLQLIGNWGCSAPLRAAATPIPLVPSRQHALYLTPRRQILFAADLCAQGIRRRVHHRETRLGMLVLFPYAMAFTQLHLPDFVNSRSAAVDANMASTICEALASGVADALVAESGARTTTGTNEVYTSSRACVRWSRWLADIAHHVAFAAGTETVDDAFNELLDTWTPRLLQWLAGLTTNTEEGGGNDDVAASGGGGDPETGTPWVIHAPSLEPLPRTTATTTTTTATIKIRVSPSHLGNVVGIPVSPPAFDSAPQHAAPRTADDHRRTSLIVPAAPRLSSFVFVDPVLLGTSRGVDELTGQDSVATMYALAFASLWREASATLHHWSTAETRRWVRAVTDVLRSLSFLAWVHGTEAKTRADRMKRPFASSADLLIGAVYRDFHAFQETRQNLEQEAVEMYAKEHLNDDEFELWIKLRDDAIHHAKRRHMTSKQKRADTRKQKMLENKDAAASRNKSKTKPKPSQMKERKSESETKTAAGTPAGITDDAAAGSGDDDADDADRPVKPEEDLNALIESTADSLMERRRDDERETDSGTDNDNDDDDGRAAGGVAPSEYAWSSKRRAMKERVEFVQADAREFVRNARFRPPEIDRTWYVSLRPAHRRAVSRRMFGGSCGDTASDDEGDTTPVALPPWSSCPSFMKWWITRGG